MQLETEARRARRRMMIVTSSIVVGLVAVAMWRFTGLRFPSLELRILIVALGTFAGGGFLYRGLLRGFSRDGGWRSAAAPLLWAVVGLSLAAGHLTAVASLPLTLLGAAFAFAGAVMQQRDRENAPQP